MIPVYQPYITELSIKYATEALGSTWISSKGKFINDCEIALRNFLKAKNVILTSNGTVATHMLSLALQFKHPSIKTIVTSNNSYVAAVNSFLYDRQYSIELIDADLKTWNMSSKNLLERFADRNDIAVLAVHNMGNIIDIPSLKMKMKNAIFVEDACEAFSGRYHDKHAGTESFASSFSFFGNKTITCGEGGAVVIDDDETFQYLRSVYSQGTTNTSKKFLHDHLGYNYRMTNVQAAILLGQLESVNEILEKKNDVFSFYEKNLSDIGETQQIDKNTSHSKWMFGIKIDSAKSFEESDEFFKNAGVEIRPMFRSLRDHPYLNKQPVKFGDDTNARLIHEKTIVIPSYPSLTSDQLNHIVETVKQFSKE